MRTLAEYIMKEQRQAVIVTLFAHLVPVFFWLGSATVALVVMRRGVNRSITVIIAGAVAALFWLSRGSPIEIITLCGTIIMGSLLRYSASWESTVSIIFPLSALVAWIMITFYTDVFTQTASSLQQAEFSTFSHLLQQNKSVHGDGQITQMLTTLLLKAYVFFCLASMLVALVLARSWQAMLYQPGGFSKEIQALRLPFTTSMALMLLWLAGYLSNSHFMHVVAPCLLLPLLFAGIALMHGIIAILRPRNVRTLLVVAYLLILLFYPVIIMLACLDSFMDFRGRLFTKKG